MRPALEERYDDADVSPTPYKSSFLSGALTIGPPLHTGRAAMPGHARATP